ncbi:uncharacterized protein CG7065 isoform X1 [Glossina fuscipes]|uniref:Uncharacterized protein CG7065 isoform X1 n=1 Tax=Glossina fuscipes TaxID=7396 RepID=A0A9C5YV51_9MUSC|nr:uncharacterized protein CG7065 isoform X1 [Glossina fuscipes]XP_037889289.1 uncharacterized protein CG7065 isoform X1 [Glossina fuscipes]XP_037889290.1 uncharacterized protein CG7065 isoform X1 [Glossina fuscipes]XP_037889292.1 uncharacterized protein CG7065 isoform X1 [Glossina fuscipes]XP_037889293.1 uncharacterized protein CG7065 isoform X1 [Glossina fuscipes]XP_037889294.1 uncharacterized protein CG7065 isoform X1 [Glossina fuscipes]KAI9581910.1 hypothetical protein GQX74_011405 [Gloss
MNITPGEPVPPGFEDEVNRVAQIQDTVDKYKGNALIGLEYSLELHEDNRHEPGYLCVLCDKRGDPRSIMHHWTSFNHRMKYLEKHYPSAVKECLPVKYKPNSHNIMILIVQSLAEAIEDHHGRLSVTVMSADEFRHKKSHYMEEVNSKYHFSERNGPNFVDAIDRTLWENRPLKRKDSNAQITIKAPKRLHEINANNKNDLDEISSDSDNDNNKNCNKKSKQQEPAYRTLPRVRRSPPFEEEREKKVEKKLPTPKELSLQASHIAQERYKWEKYRCMLEIQLKQMEKIQQDYEKNPEKHPSYPEEWKKFWNRRYKELQTEKKVDPNKYDYKPEWIVYWTARMKELFNVEVEKKKKEIKVKLGLPEDAEEKVDQLKEKYKVPVNRTIAVKKISEGRASEDVIDISDDDSPKRSRRSRSRSRSRDYKRSRSRSLSPFSDDYELNNKHYSNHRHRPTRSRGYNAGSNSSSGLNDYYGYTRSRYTPTHYPSSSTHYRVLDSHKIPKYEERSDLKISSVTKETKEEPPKDEGPEGPLTVVAVLRLLTALEDHLGSLGPKVVDLLGKALALEKVKANSSDDLVMNEDHCVFFETIKEKLKGLLIADVLDDQQKVRAVKKAIKNIAALIHQVTTKGPQTDSTVQAGNENKKNPKESTKQSTNSKVSSSASIKDLPFDRQVVATKLAASLVIHGREDVSTEDMDKLIFMYILMVKLSKSKREVDGKPIYTKDILLQLGISTSTPPGVGNKPTSAALAALPGIVDELFEKELTSLVQEVEEEIDNESMDKESRSDGNSNMLESLTDSDLQTLLQNFKHLSNEEQHHLIAHLKKLESADPARVEKLRKFVNFADMIETSRSTTESTKSKETPPVAGSRSKNFNCNDSPPANSNKDKITAPGTEEDEHRRRPLQVNPSKFALDDEEEEDDDYNFEEVFKAASSNVNSSSEEHLHQSNENKSSKSTHEAVVPAISSPTSLTFNPAGFNISLNDTQNLIANIMGSLQQSNSGPKCTTGNNHNNNNKSPTVPKPVPAVPIQPQPVPPIAPAASKIKETNIGGGAGGSNDSGDRDASSAIGNRERMLPQNMSNMPYYPHQQQETTPYNYNQMNNPGYYNMMPTGPVGGYNQNAYAPGYQQWDNGPPQMQSFGVQGFSMPSHPQPNQPMGYNMYGQGGN